MFGIKIEDIFVLEMIESMGYTVSEAYDMWSSGEAPKHLKGILDEYESKLQTTLPKESK